MKTVGYGLLIAAILTICAGAQAAGVHPIFADGTLPLGPDTVPHILQGGALGVLAFTVWFMLARAWPAQTAALREQRESFLNVIQTERRELQEERRQMREFIETLVKKFTGTTGPQT